MSSGELRRLQSKERVILTNKRSRPTYNLPLFYALYIPTLGTVIQNDKNLPKKKKKTTINQREIQSRLRRRGNNSDYDSGY